MLYILDQIFFQDLYQLLFDFVYLDVSAVANVGIVFFFNMVYHGFVHKQANKSN